MSDGGTGYARTPEATRASWVLLNASFSLIQATRAIVTWGMCGGMCVRGGDWLEGLSLSHARARIGPRKCTSSPRACLRLSVLDVVGLGVRCAG